MMKVEPAMIMAGQNDHVNRFSSQERILASDNSEVDIGVVSTGNLCNTYSQMQREKA